MRYYKVIKDTDYSSTETYTPLLWSSVPPGICETQGTLFPVVTAGNLEKTWVVLLKKCRSNKRSTAFLLDEDTTILL